jgi:hypothetical protein
LGLRNNAFRKAFSVYIPGWKNIIPALIIAKLCKTDSLFQPGVTFPMPLTQVNKKPTTDGSKIMQNNWLPPGILLLLVIGIIFARCPELLTSPRFWAEEGEIYFSEAFNSGIWRSLFLQHLGYYNIIPNLAAGLATLVPLEQAPFVTTYIALLIQVLVSAVVIFGNSPYWDTWPKKFLIACGIQLINPFEVWLTTISAHFWLCIATFFILLENPYGNERIRRYFHRVILAIAGFSSVVSIFLTPFFIRKAWRDSCRESWIQAGILTTAGAIQACALVIHLLAHESLPAGSRLGDNQFSLPLFIDYHIIWPFFDEHITNWIPIFVGNTVILGLGLFLLYLLFNSLKSGKYLTIFLAFSLLVLLSTLLSISMASAPRYAFAPSAMLLVILVCESSCENNTVTRWLALAFVAVISVSCITGFRSRIFYSPDLPRWQAEVALWRADPGKPLKIWPQFESRSCQINLADKTLR